MTGVFGRPEGHRKTHARRPRRTRTSSYRHDTSVHECTELARYYHPCCPTLAAWHEYANPSSINCVKHMSRSRWCCSLGTCGRAPRWPSPLFWSGAQQQATRTRRIRHRRLTHRPLGLLLTRRPRAGRATTSNGAAPLAPAPRGTRRRATCPLRRRLRVAVRRHRTTGQMTSSGIRRAMARQTRTRANRAATHRSRSTLWLACDSRSQGRWRWRWRPARRALVWQAPLAR